MHDQRVALIKGTRLTLDGGSSYLITDEPIGYGGGSIIYPAQKLIFTDGSWHSDGFEYALKECFPAPIDRNYLRSSSGEIRAEGSDNAQDIILSQAKQRMLSEGEITQNIYQTASRIMPVREGALSVTLDVPGKNAERVQNAVVVMDSLHSKGRSLSSYVREHGFLTPIQCFRAIQQVLFSLREVHQAGYLHLDIQDGNILLKGALDDESNLATLIDFGSARAMKDGQTEPIVDQLIFTTQGYSAPEILYKNDGTLRLGVEADLYSVGCLALYLLTGCKYSTAALMGNTDGKYLSRFKLRKIQCPRHLVDQMQMIIARALQNEPEHRYHSADEMLADVMDFIAALQPHRSDLRSVNYDAFICYKHGDIDSAVARMLQQQLEHFRAPKGYAKQKYPFKRVFMDTGELSSCADYGEQIRAALKNSSWLIVVCSPSTPTSPWVQAEIEAFLEYHDRSRILAVLTEGEPEEAFPSMLKGQADGSGEVLAADVRGARAAEVFRKLKRDGLTRIAAPMLGVPYDSLKQRRKLYVMKRVVAFSLAALMLACAFGAFALVQNIHINEQRNEASKRESRYLAVLAEETHENGDRSGAINIALSALPSKAQDRPYVADAERALASALHSYDISGDLAYDRKFSMNGDILRFATCGENTLIAITNNDWMGAFDIETGDVLWQKHLTELVSGVGECKLSSFYGVEALLVDEERGQVLLCAHEGVLCVDSQSGAIRWVWNSGPFYPEDDLLQGDYLYLLTVETSAIDSWTVLRISLESGACENIAQLACPPVDATNGARYCVDMYKSRARICFDEAANSILLSCSMPRDAADSAYNDYITALFVCDLDTHLVERSQIDGAAIAMRYVDGAPYIVTGIYGDREGYLEALQLTKLSIVKAKEPQVLWTAQAELNEELFYFESSNPVFFRSGTDYITLGLERQLFSFSSADGSMLKTFDLDSSIRYLFPNDADNGVGHLMLEDGSLIWLYSYNNWIGNGSLRRSVRRALRVSDHWIVNCQDAPQDLFVIRPFCDEGYEKMLSFGEDVASMRYALSSPDGEMLLLAYSELYEQGQRYVSSLLLSPDHLDEASAYRFDTDFCSSLLQLSENGERILWLDRDNRLCCTDLLTGETEELAKWDSPYNNAVAVAPFELGQHAMAATLECDYEWQAVNSYAHAFHLRCFEDGMPISDLSFKLSLPDHASQKPDTLRIGHNGYCSFIVVTEQKPKLVVYKIADDAFSIYDYPLAVTDQTYMALSSQKPLLAAADMDGKLRLWDLRTGKISLTVEGLSSGCAWCQFAAEDTLLLALTKDGRLLVFDTNTGETLGSSTAGIPYKADTIHLVEDDAFIYLYTQGDATGDGCIISKQDMGICAYIEDMMGCLPAQDALLVAYDAGIAFYPIYSLEDLQDEAIKQIGSQKLTQQECVNFNMDPVAYAMLFNQPQPQLTPQSPQDGEREVELRFDSYNAKTIQAPLLEQEEETEDEPESYLILTELEDGSVLAKWVEVNPAVRKHNIRYRYGDILADDSGNQYNYSIEENYAGDEYLIEDLIPDTLYTILLYSENGDAIGTYIHTSPTEPYAKEDISYHGALLARNTPDDVIQTVEATKAAIAEGDLSLYCVFDTTADAPESEQKMLLRFTAASGTVAEKGIMVKLAPNQKDQVVRMDVRLGGFLKDLEDRYCAIPAGTYTVDLYLDRSFLGSATFSLTN